jgi:hypothetical protein
MNETANTVKQDERSPMHVLPKQLLRHLEKSETARKVRDNFWIKHRFDPVELCGRCINTPDANRFGQMLLAYPSPFPTCQ